MEKMKKIKEKRKVSLVLNFFYLLLLNLMYFSSCLSNDKTNFGTAQNGYNQKTIEVYGCKAKFFEPYMFINALYDSLAMVKIELKNELTLIHTGIFSVNIADKQTEFSRNLEVVLVDFQPCLKSLREFNMTLNEAYFTYSHCSDIEFEVDSPYYYRIVAGNIQIEAKGEVEGRYGKARSYLINMQDCMFKHDSTKKSFFIPSLKMKATID